MKIIIGLLLFWFACSIIQSLALCITASRSDRLAQNLTARAMAGPSSATPAGYRQRAALSFWLKWQQVIKRA